MATMLPMNLSGFSYIVVMFFLGALSLNFGKFADIFYLIIFGMLLIGISLFSIIF